MAVSLFHKTDANHWLTCPFFGDVKFYMQDDGLIEVDRMSVANSLEGRCPLSDQKVTEFGVRVPLILKLHGIRCKKILMEAMRDCLPAPVVSRPNQDFSIPLADWLCGGCCRDYAGDLLFQPDAFIYGFARPHPVQRL